MPDTPEVDSDCGPLTSQSDLNRGLSGNSGFAPSSSPKRLDMDKQIEARYGKATDAMSQMKTTGQSERFSGPGDVP